MRRLLPFIGLLTGLMLSATAQEYRGTEARRIAEGAEWVWMQPHLQLPAFVRFSPAHQVPLQQMQGYLQEQFIWQRGEDGLIPLRSETDPLGHQHDRYRQTYHGIPVEGSMLILHSNQGQVYAFNGTFFALKQDLVLSPSLTEAAALQQALSYVGASVYKWQVEEEEAHLQMSLGEGATYYPKGELVLAPEGGDFRGKRWRLAWKYDIYAHQPLSRRHVYVDAQNGEVFWEVDRIHTSDTPGTAVTKYSNVQTITTDSTANGFRLRESGRGNGIRTWDMNQGTSYGAAVDFVDSDNYWNNVNPQQDEVATDAHWGAEMTYDYFFSKYGRNSIDGQGFQLNSYVHYDQNYANAFWDGSRMTYGDGSGGGGNLSTPLTALDIAGHEIAHGLTNFTADLIYQNESGALNESFSDLFGKAIENYARPTRFSWRIGGDLGTGIRDMANPNLFNDPKNYLGNSWYTGTGDNGGVHINSGVQNHWFYLLVSGGSGTNDFGNSYNVSGVGMDTAGAVAFRNLTVYLTPSSNYEDARFYAIQSAIDLYGACGRIHQMVENAWYAVGVGQQPFSVTPVSDFSVSATELCSQPYEIKFTAQTSLANSYRWYFGDGDSSTLANPVHTYATPGTYSVTLNIDAVCGGAATETKQNLITTLPAPATPTLLTPATSVSCGDSLMLVATGTDEISWYNSNGEVIGTGDTLFTPVLKTPATYYARNIEASAPQNVGPANGSFVGAGGFHNNAFEARLEFEVYKTLRLGSVWVNAGSAGPRTIVLEDENGNLIDSRTVFIPSGQGRITLDFDIRPGKYQIGGANMNLFRNSAGANYPYEIQGVVAITGSNATSSSSFYYYLYDWEITTFCSSADLAVPVNVAPLPDPQVGNVSLCESGPATFTVSNPQGKTNWYDGSGNLLATGATYTTAPISTSTTVYVEAEISDPAQQVGPLNGAFVGNGSYHNTAFDARLFFEVYKAVKLKSVWVDAGSAGNRDIVLEDGSGNLLQTLSIFIPNGQGRIPLNLDLQPGSYAIGGAFMDLYRNSGGANFPYTLPGLVSITGSNANTNSDFYYYFYDWEVQEPACYSNQIPVTATVSGQPAAGFSYLSNGGQVDFSDLSSNASMWNWDFGDGNSASVQNPSHSYAASGVYTVTQIAANSGCSDTTSQEVSVEISTDLGDLLDEGGLKLYPNPGSGAFRVEADLRSIETVQLRVYNGLGQLVFTGAPQQTADFRQEVNIGALPAGTYLVQLQAGRHLWMQKYLKKDN